MADSKSPLARARFRVIEGGPPPAAVKAARPKRTKKVVPRYRPFEVPDSPPAEQERLRRAILALPLEDCGIAVEQALDEMSERAEDSTTAAISRLSFLSGQLYALGLLVHTVNPDLGLARNCFLELYNPALLLSKHPELVPLRPENNRNLEIG